MKLKRICALALCSALCAGLVTLTASADSNTAETYDGSLTVDKTAAANDDGTYTVSLEASLKEVACDIVLVVDQSGSMGDTYAQDDGEWVYTKHTWERAIAGNIPPFGTGIFEDDAKHQGPFFIYDETDEKYYELERYWTGAYKGIYFVKYRYVDASGKEHVYDADSVPLYGDEVTYYTREWVGGTKYSKSDVAQSQLKSLMAEISNVAGERGLDHRIAVVGFGCGQKTFTGSTSSQKFNYENTGLYDNGVQTKMPDITDEQYKSALKSVKTESSNITNSIDALKSENLPSLHQYGLEMANEILENNGDSTRKKIVVVITDGAPGWTGAYDGDCATPALTQAAALKAQGATIYTINMAEEPDSNTTAFMKNISSSGCYTLATKKEAFESAIASVKAGIAAQSALPLDTDTQLVDTLSAYFKFADTPNVRYAWVENDGEAEYISVPEAQYSISQKTITLNGFDFQTHISNDTKTEKLIVQFEIEPETGFLGGNGVPTNTNTSAIKNDGETYPFPVPDVDVAIPDLTVSGLTDKNIYLLGSVSTAEMLDGVTAAGNGATIKWDQKDNNYGLESWQNEFVNISFTAQSNCDGKTDGNYSVTCTVTAKTDANNTATVTANKNVYVFKPTLKYDDYTVYLGGSVPAFEPQSITWKHGETVADTTEMGTAPILSDCTYSQSKDFTDCSENVSLTGVKIGTTSVIDYVTAEAFTVHVLKPTLSATDTTIYYGSSISLGTCMNAVTWSDENNKHNADSKGYGTVPTPNYSYTVGGETVNASYSPDDCKTVTAAWTLGKDNEKFEKTFTVHVAKPSFNTTPVTIYRGNDTNLNDRVKVTEWKCSDTGSNQQTKSDGIEPTVLYTFKEVGATEKIDGATAYKPDDCKNLTVTATIGNKEGWTDIPKFTVHVLQPVFTVTTQDVWADYGTPVDLATNCIKTCELSWADQTDNKAGTAEGDEPKLTDEGTVLTYNFTPATGLSNGKYTVGENDQTFKINKFTYKLSNKLTDEVTYESGKEPNFTVHVNKFQLTINKTWDGADCYKQDAIFTVTGGPTNSFKVVIPKDKEQSSVTIGGLLCGQTYTVTEDGNWSWRWESSNNGNTTTGYSSHIHTAVTNADPMSGKDPVKMSFTNTLKDGKNGREDRTLWLSGDWWCQNTCTGNSIKKMDTTDLKKKTK